MMHIIYAVIAIALTCLATFGGVSYMRAEAPTRVVSSRGLMGQYEAILTGIASYRNANNGIYPDSLERFAGYLPNGTIPSFGTAAEGYEWEIVQPNAELSPVVCLTVDTSMSVRYEAATIFTMDAIRRGGGRVNITVGDACGAGVPFTEGMDAPQSDRAFFTLRGY